MEEMEYAQIAAGAALHYLAATENENIRHINKISRIHPESHVWLDRFTIRNLELIHPSRSHGKSLLDILDETISPMGSRLLKKWVILPLISIHAIRARHDSVQYLIEAEELRDELEIQIRKIGDLERVMSKVAIGKINPREINQLKIALLAIEPIKEKLSATGDESLKKLSDRLQLCLTLREKIENRSILRRRSICRKETSSKRDSTMNSTSFEILSTIPRTFY